jgi:hypothetical protein
MKYPPKIDLLKIARKGLSCRDLLHMMPAAASATVRTLTPVNAALARVPGVAKAFNCMS